MQRWAERTPDGFVMHVKAFGVMTRHPVKIEQLPPDLRDEAPQDERGRVDRPSREFRAEIFRRFLEALEPLRAAGKLGGLLFQFPPYIVPQGGVARLPRVGARADRGRRDARRVPAPQLGSRTISATRRCASSRSTRCRHVVVDAPRSGGQERPADRARADVADPLRAHARAERGDVERARRERGGALRLPLLGRGARRVGAAAEGAVRAGASRRYVLFNNNNRSRVGGREDAQAPTNAEMLRGALAGRKVAVSRPGSGAPAGSRRSARARRR